MSVFVGDDVDERPAGWSLVRLMAPPKYRLGLLLLLHADRLILIYCSIQYSGNYIWKWNFVPLWEQWVLFKKHVLAVCKLLKLPNLPCSQGLKPFS